jgi:hypothetical protein
MKIRLINTILLLTIVFVSSAYENLSKEDYIAMWKQVAIQEMQTHKIPASITLAQGILESSYGNSLLAREANNHFGIKCHDWKGPTIYKDDDNINDCFRKYENATESFKDHSNFLTTRSRYADLFTLELTDYKGWAKGLKNAGYATNPKYAELLINLIEEFNLNKYDLNLEIQTLAFNKENQLQISIDENNRKYILVDESQTMVKISMFSKITLRQLYSYNDFPDTKYFFNTNEKIYLMPKSRKCKSLNAIKLVEDKLVWEISQEYGIKMKRLMKLNDFNIENQLIQKGTAVRLN